MASTQCGWASGFKSWLRNWGSERARADGCGSAWQECMEQTKQPLNDQSLGERTCLFWVKDKKGDHRYTHSWWPSINQSQIMFINLLFLFYTGCVTSTIVSQDRWVACTIRFSSLKVSALGPHILTNRIQQSRTGSKKFRPITTLW